jgi:hypothetical protein
MAMNVTGLEVLKNSLYEENALFFERFVEVMKQVCESDKRLKGRNLALALEIPAGPSERSLKLVVSEGSKKAELMLYADMGVYKAPNRLGPPDAKGFQLAISGERGADLRGYSFWPQKKGADFSNPQASDIVEALGRENGSRVFFRTRFRTIVANDLSIRLG